jgi:hypothetical protein
LVKYKHLFEENRTIYISVYAVDAFGTSHTGYFKIEVVALKLLPQKDPMFINRNSNFIFSYSMIGGTSDKIKERNMVYTF